MEPRASHPRDRLRAIEELAAAGVPVSVNVAPVVPGLNDHEIPAILRAAAAAGARYAGYVLLRLPGAVAPLFEGWLADHYPERRTKVMGRIRQVRGGRVNEVEFGRRMRGRGPYADSVAALFTTALGATGLERRGPQLSTEAFRRPGGPQLGLFDGPAGVAEGVD
jgi:DNA repair photolyase